VNEKYPFQKAQCHIPFEIMIEQETKITAHHQLGEKIFLLELQAPGIAASAEPGQFVMLRIQPGLDPLLRRPFSICGQVGGKVLLILYRIIGRGTSLLAGQTKGGNLSTLGPLGRGFSKPGKPDIPILIAGGIGLPPLLYLARTLSRPDLHLLAGFSTKSEIIPLDRIMNPLPRLSVSTEDGSSGFQGAVTDLFQEHLTTLRKQREKIRVYACGPAGMLKEIARICSSESLKCQVSLESHMACGLGACLGCAVRAAPETGKKYMHVCKDGPVFASKDIDWTSIG
jgi:dihydroorotate dehydrogenase electron transfer subunit